MSWCGGRVCCEIYRDKKYCRRGNHAADSKPCDCRHARFACEVNECHGAGDWCPGPEAVTRTETYIKGGYADG